jgi:hypothetical protein
MHADLSGVRPPHSFGGVRPPAVPSHDHIDPEAGRPADRQPPARTATGVNHQSGLPPHEPAGEPDLPTRAATTEPGNRAVPARRSDPGRAFPHCPQPPVVRATTTFYDRDAIRITERWLSIGQYRYRINQLDNLRKARGPADRIAQRAAYTAALSLPALLTIGPHIPPPATLVLTGTLVALPAAMAAVRARLRPAAYQLWADYNGAPVQLHQTRNKIEFGKISRALVRASTCVHASLR